MEAVHILFRGNGHEHRLFIDAVGQGELAEDAVDLLPAVELVDEVDQRLLGGGGGQGVLLAVEAALLAVLPLAGDVHPGGRVVPHQHHRQPRLPGQLGRLLPHAVLYLGRQGLAVNDCRRHR